MPPDTMTMIQDGEWFNDSLYTEYLDSLGNILQVTRDPVMSPIKWKFQQDGLLQISSMVIPCSDVFINSGSFSYKIENGILHTSTTTPDGVSEEHYELKSLDNKEMVLRNQQISKLVISPNHTLRSRYAYKLIKNTYPERFKNWPCP